MGADTFQNSFHCPEKTGIYPVHLEVGNDENCENAITMSVIINNEFIIHIPSAFSSNGDNINNTFYPQGTGINPSNYKLYIFNRWGELIFESNDLDKH